MATWQHLRSSTANKRPTTSLADGRIAINTNTASPGLFFKDSAGTGIVKVGPVHVGTTAPNSVPAAGGSSGNYTGEQWLDTSVSPAQMKVWNGSTWVGIVADELPVSKLQDGAARQLIQTDAAGTGVEWTSDVDVPGTLDVTSTATFDSIAQHPLGSAGAPTITFTGDTNTGIYSPGADQVAISTNGAERLRITSAGTALLQGTERLAFNTYVSDSNHAGYLGRDTSTGALVIEAQNAGGGYPITFRTSSTERVRITDQGLVGVGTSSPASLLNIKGSAANGFSLTHSNNTVISELYELSGAQGAGLSLKNSSGTTNVFFNAGGDSYINGGRLGIGTTGPNAALDVAVARSATVDSAIFGTTGTGVVADVNRILIKNVNTLGGQNQGVGIGGVLAASASNEAHLTFYSNPGSGVTERARIDSSGRLLVGTSSALTGGSFAQYAKIVSIGSTAGAAEGASLALGRGEAATSIATGEQLGAISFTDNTGNEFAQIYCVADANAGSGDYPGRLVFSVCRDGSASPTEALRIRNTGQVDVFGTANTGLYVRTAGAANSSDALIVGVNSATGTTDGTTSFIVRPNGNVQNTNNSYGAISDIKLKENIVDAGSQWDDLKALQVRKYNFKEGETHTQIGLIAQEVELVSPGLVTESPDRDAEGNDLGTVTKSVNYSVLYMKAVKALQEAMERIEQLEAKVAALEAA